MVQPSKLTTIVPMTSTDGMHFVGPWSDMVSGYHEWAHESVDLSGRAGAPKVWISFDFSTHHGFNYYEGEAPYVDNVRLITSAPTITSLSPTAGPLTGNNNVIINGTNFTGATRVAFGGVDALSYTVNSATKITAKAPAHAAGMVQVKVTAPAGSTANTAADDYTYMDRPTITSLSPKAGPLAGNNTVIINGTNFTGATKVTFGGVNAFSYTVNSATKITAKAPAHVAGMVQVKVRAPGAHRQHRGGRLHLYGRPTITSLSPIAGPPPATPTCHHQRHRLHRGHQGDLRRRQMPPQLHGQLRHQDHGQGSASCGRHGAGEGMGSGGLHRQHRGGQLYLHGRPHHHQPQPHRRPLGRQQQRHHQRHQLHRGHQGGLRRHRCLELHGQLLHQDHGQGPAPCGRERAGEGVGSGRL